MKIYGKAGRLVSLMMAVILCLSLLPGMHVKADTFIQTIEIGIDCPAIGEHPDYFPVFPEDAHYFNIYTSEETDEIILNNVMWHDLTTDEHLQVDDSVVFEALHTYSVIIYLNAEDGYDFDETLINECTVNGMSTDFEKSLHQLRVECTFPTLFLPLNAAAVTITEPAAGASADYHPAVPAGAHYTAVAEWYDAPPESGSGQNIVDRFQANREYWLRIYLSPADDYAFEDGTVVTLNGKTADASFTYPGNNKQLTIIQHYGPLADAGWKKNAKGWWYRRADGTYPKNQWEKIGGKWYHFDADGYMQTNWLKLNGTWYYLGSSGAMVTGWNQIGGKWYYFSSSGAMQTGWKTIGGKTYYFKDSGAMAAKEWCSGWWLNADGTWTYKYKASWKKNSKGWWYGDTSGWYAKNCTIKIDGKNYTFDANGYMK